MKAPPTPVNDDDKSSDDTTTKYNRATQAAEWQTVAYLLIIIDIVTN